MNTTHIMVDLETLASSNRAAIVSIGAVAFDPYTGEINPAPFYINVDAQSCERAGLEISGSTVMWWLQQSDEARTALFNNPVPLKEALTQFSAWVRTHAGGTPTMWGNGATFDNIVLRNAYAAADVYAPWKYNRDFCYRTMKNVFPGVPMTRSGTHHNALDDAMTQTVHLVNIFRTFKSTTEALAIAG